MNIASGELDVVSSYGETVIVLLILIIWLLAILRFLNEYQKIKIIKQNQSSVNPKNINTGKDINNFFMHSVW